MTGVETTDYAFSIATARSDAADPFVNETLPNGGYINIGAYGNTEQASKSPAQYVLVLNPNGGEGVPLDAVVDIRWRSDGFAGTVDIEYSTTGPAGTFLPLALGEVNDDSFLWTADSSFPASNNYVIRISTSETPAVSDVTDDVFTVTGPITSYYVNDDSLIGDEAPPPVGPDANDSPARRVASH